MIGIRVATLLHILWGLYLVAFWRRAPAPFGGFEPYLVLIHPFSLGVIFLCIGALAFIKNFLPDPWWLKPILVVPQQIVLVWGLLGGLYLVLTKGFGTDIDRMVLAMCYGLSITVFHTVDMFHLWHESLLRREIENGSAGTARTS